MGQGRAFSILLWKNFLIRKRQPFLLCAELIWPLVLFLVLAAIRTRGLIKTNPECHFNGRAMPSAGLVPLLQSIVCSTGNICNNQVVQGEIPGVTQSYPGSGISNIMKDLYATYALFTPARQGQLGQLVDNLLQIATVNPLLLNATLSQPTALGLAKLMVNVTNLQNDITAAQLPISSNLVRQLGTITLTAASFPMNISDPLLLLATLMQPEQSLLANASSIANDSLRVVLCQSNFLESTFSLNLSQTEDARSQLCNLTAAQMRKFVQLVASNAQINGTSATDLYANLTTTIIDLAPFFGSVSRTLRRMTTRFANTGDSASTISLFLCNQASLRILSTSDSLSSYQELLLSLPSFTQSSSTVQLPKGFPADQLSSFCSQLLSPFETTKSTNTLSSLIWHQFKPFVRGKIPFAPDTPFTRQLMARANRTFADASVYLTAANDWLSLSGSLRSLITLTSTQNAIKVLSDACYRSVNLGLTTAGRMLFTADCVSLNFLLTSANSTQQNNLYTTLSTIDVIATQLVNLAGCFDFDKLVPLKNEQELESWSSAFASQNRLWGGIYFDVANNMQSSSFNGTKPTYIHYKIRMSSEKVDSTNAWFDSVNRPGPRSNPVSDLKYLQYGFAYLQDMVERAFIELQINSSVDDGVYLQQFPYPCYISDTFTNQLPTSLPLFMVLSWLLSAAVVIKNIVYEREQQLKVLMRVMGLRNATHWSAWFTSCLLVMLVSAVALVILIKYGRILPRSDPSLVFVIVFSYLITTILFAFLLSQAFRRANVAAVSGGVIFFVTYLPYVFIVSWSGYLPPAAYSILSLFSNVAMSLAFRFVSELEQSGTGAKWVTIAQPVELDNSFTLLSALLFLWLDAVIYFLLIGYIDYIKPIESDGCGKRWYYPFTAQFWCPQAASCPDSAPSDTSPLSLAMYDSEPEPSLTVSVHVQHLTKRYGQNAPALNDVSLAFYDGQISGLLGHNGAGKSTFLSVLTGLAAPTAGRVSVYGLQLATQAAAIRRRLGFCPQHNVLYDLLTVEEHILLYGRLKGVPDATLRDEVDRLVRATRLTHKRHALSKTLSGGMKRKLSIAIAFIGDNIRQSDSPSAPHKLIVLDEPTAGVDPHARRAIWDLLIQFKRDNTIVFTTHHMDEADMLSDRIFIVSRGMLCAVGSSAFLKRTFGSGYYLALVKAPSELADSESKPPADAAASNADAEEDVDEHAKRALEFLHRFIPTALLVENTPTELTFLLPPCALPSGASTSAAAAAASNAPESTSVYLSSLFRALDSAMLQLGLSSYGLSDTTLEEVFLKLVEGDVPSASGGPRSEFLKRHPAALLTDDALERGVQQQTDDGLLPRPTTRLSFRRDSCNSSINKKHKSMLHKLNPAKWKVPRSSGAQHTQLQDSTSLSGWSVNSALPPSSLLGDTTSSSTPSLLHQKLHKATGSKLLAMQFHALIAKRWLHLKRSKLGWISEVLLPVFFVLLSLVACQITPSPSPYQQPLEIHPWLLAPSNGAQPGRLRFVYSNDNYSYSLANRLESALLLSSSHHGTRCINASLHTIAGYRCLLGIEPSFGSDLLLNPQVSNAQQYANLFGTALSAPNILIALRNLLGLNNTADTLQLPQAVCSASTRTVTGPTAAQSWTVWLNTLIATGDYVQQLTGHNLSMYLVQTNAQYEKLLYGAYSLGNTNPLAFFFPLANSNASVQPIGNLAYVPVGSQQLLASTLNRYLTNGVPITPFNPQSAFPVSPILNASLNPAYLRPYAARLLAEVGQVLRSAYVANNEKVWFNNKGYVSSIAYMNALNNVRLRAYVQSAIDLATARLGSAASASNVSQLAGLASLNLSDYGMTLVSHPLNLTAKQFASVALEATQTSLVVAVSLVFALAFLPASFVMYLIADRVSRSKLLQCLTGLPPTLYWAANFAWDYANYTFSTLIILLLFAAFSQSATPYIGPQTGGALVAILFAYGFAAVPMLYPFSFICTVPSTSFVFLSCASLLIGSITTITTVLLDSFSDTQLNAIGTVLESIFPIFPQYCLGRSAIELNLISATNQVLLNTFGPSYPLRSPWQWNSAGKFVVYLLVEGVVFSALTLAIEFRRNIYAALRSICHLRASFSDDEAEASPDEDPDVARERARVLDAETRGGPCDVHMSDRSDAQSQSASSDTDDVLRLINLTKVYRSVGTGDGSCSCKVRRFVAARGLSVGLKRAECFGLLGVNGAGKTTTFKMLTGDVRVTHGDARIAGYSVRNELQHVRASIGYCPQFDALSGHLTGAEHLDLYARLRGIAPYDRTRICAAVAARLGLSEHAHRPVHSYSGGTKRKLSTAIALLGQPTVLLLDEPTSGMDPQARRFLWDVLRSVLDELRCTVVLTTHSMDECEELCTRLAVMVNGTFRCLGSVTHLKNRFGGGYMLQVRLKHQAIIGLAPVSRRRLLATIADDVRHMLPVKLSDSQNTLLEFHLPSVRSGTDDLHSTTRTLADADEGINSPTLADVFEQLEALRTRHSAFVCDYSVCLTSLDHVFIHFAKMQTELQDESACEDIFPQRQRNGASGDPNIDFTDLADVPNDTNNAEAHLNGQSDATNASAALAENSATSCAFPNPIYTHDDNV